MLRGVVVFAALGVATGAWLLVGSRADETWSGEELALLRSLALPAGGYRAPADPSNRFGTRRDAADLGRKLFEDTRLSANGKVSCASCHQPKRSFQDGRPLGRGLGTTPRRTMTIVGAAGQPWLFWDGRKDSLWSQALGPLENAAEHGLTRIEVARVVARAHRGEYERVFGPLPALAGLPRRASPVGSAAERAAWRSLPQARRRAVNRAFANVGKAIAAFERRLRPGRARFDRYVAAAVAGDRERMRALLSDRELEGLRLFLGDAHCVDCHSGPLLTNGEFHNTGVPGDDPGRAGALRLLRADEFNCLGPYSDADRAACAVRFLPAATGRLRGAFKPPSLRDVAARAPYMHAGQFSSLGAVVRHYNRAPAAVAGESELEPLGLDEDQLDAIVAFLRTLSAED
jgi:cytochrome c peroxidase